MSAWLLALAVTLAGGMQLECALVIPTPGDLALTSRNLVHDATHGVTVASPLDDDTIEALFDGRSARFVVAGAAPLSGEPSRMRLPLASGELVYLALRDGRPTTHRVLDPAAVTVEARWEPAPDGSRLSLRLEVVQLAAQQRYDEQANVSVGEPAFARRAVEVQLPVEPDRPVLLLLESAAEARVGEQNLELTFRRRVGSQTIESMAPLLGLVVRVVPEGAPLRFERVTPPVAPPGMVKVVGDVPQPGSFTYRDGLRSTDVLADLGLPDPATGLEVTRLRADGGIERIQVDAATAARGFPLQGRDVITVQRTSQPTAGVRRAEERQLEEIAPAAPARAGGGGMSGAPGLRGPQGSAGPQPAGTAATPLAEQTARSGYSLPWSLEELRRVAPAAARGSAAAVALRARVQRDGQERELLMAGTIVSADGLLVTAPAGALDGAEDVRALLENGSEWPCRRIATDPTGALLALRIPTTDLTALPLAEIPPEVGAPLVVIGHPYGLLRSVTVTVRGGPPREVPAAPGATLQLDGALAFGNSGGPVVDLEGRLVGIAYGTLRAAEPGPSISFAVPAERLRAFLESLRQ